LKKTFCLDTNVFLYDPRAVFSFEDNDVVIPLAVLEEIDKQKQRCDDAGKNARATNRLLDELRQRGNIVTGVELPGGGMLRILKSRYNAGLMPAELDPDKVDNFIISSVIELQQELEMPVMLVTKDISMRIKCDTLGVPCDDYLKHRVAGAAESIYGGVQVTSIPRQTMDAFYREKLLSATGLDLSHEPFPNEFVVLKCDESPSGSALARFIGGVLRPIHVRDEVWGLRPRNKEQKLAFDALLDDDIKLVSLIGMAGCGKSLLALAAGVKQVLEDKKYSKMIVTRPIQPMGRDIGYLPGTKEEKMEPWIQPIMDNLEFLFGPNKNKSTLEMYFSSGVFEVEALTYIRGRSIPNAYLLVDEAQNLTVHELKTIITRVGEGTKLVLTGDIEQIDNDQIDAVSNGLTYAVEKFKGESIASHITLLKGERSRLASLAAEIL